MSTLEVPKVNSASIPESGKKRPLHYKDEILDRLAEKANVAQFVSFGPDMQQRHSRILGYTPNEIFPSASVAIGALLEAAPDGSVNIRSYTPEHPQSHTFFYDIRSVDEAESKVRKLSSEGLYMIINERIDVNDGGVSGVAVGNVLEFSPEDTPRCVEKPGTVLLERETGLRLLEKVYRFRPNLDYERRWRVEFSIHPLKRGFRHEHTIVWELEEVSSEELTVDTRWPNRFSRFVGDKAFGLLLADVLGLPVPATYVVPRKLPPFSFGRPTSTSETWIRTCPVEQDPGHFTTKRGWCDPFKLLNSEDPSGDHIASILAQEGVEAVFSGALVSTLEGALLIEGVQGVGDQFMQGRAAPDELPKKVSDSVRQLYERAAAQLGPVRLEWVYDGQNSWIVQMHRGATVTSGHTIYPGEASYYHRLQVSGKNAIDELRNLVPEVKGTGEGIILVGDVGITSHLGDILRRAQIPSRIEPSQSS